MTGFICQLVQHSLVFYTVSIKLFGRRPMDESVSIASVQTTFRKCIIIEALQNKAHLFHVQMSFILYNIARGVYMKIFASDFDNTLHFVDENNIGYFKEDDMKAIQKYRENGNLFGLCTGRPLYGFEGDMDDGPVLDFVVASTGGIVTKTNHNTFETIHETVMSVEQVEAIQNLCEGRGILYIHANGKVYTLFHRRAGYDSQTVLPSVSALEGKHITAISIWTASLEMAETLTNEINARFLNALEAFQNVNWLDVVHMGVSKGNGAKSAKEMMHADILGGIGDSFNDIPLLEAADVAFTFHRCDDRVKEKADYVVDSVAEALEIFKKL